MVDFGVIGNDVCVCIYVAKQSSYSPLSHFHHRHLQHRHHHHHHLHHHHHHDHHLQHRQHHDTLVKVVAYQEKAPARSRYNGYRRSQLFYLRWNIYFDIFMSNVVEFLKSDLQIDKLSPM